MGLERDPASFRDPSGHILRFADQIYRSLDQQSFSTIQSFVASGSYAELKRKRLLVGTEVVDEEASRTIADLDKVPDRRYLRHDEIAFVTFPHEWCPEMLVDAALCTLDVQLSLLNAGYSLKDASAYNVQWESEDGPRPVFIDVPSIEPIQDASGIWIPFKQFASQFLLPLLLYRKLGLDYRGVFLSELDGLDPEAAYGLLSLRQRLLPPFLTTVTLPHLLRRFERGRPPRERSEPAEPPSKLAKEKAQYLLRHTANSLRKKVRKNSKPKAGSEWTEYDELRSYTEDARREKDDFVRTSFEQIAPKRVLDIGANAGRFSFMAADAGASVVAIDTDMAVLDRLYRRAQELSADVLPLRVDLSNPTPAIGWRNRERPSFFERMPQADSVLALAVVHHLMVSKGIPLDSVIDLLHSLTTKWLVLELVDVSDPMYQRLLAGRNTPPHLRLTIEEQHTIVTSRFTEHRSASLSVMDRRIYLLEKR